jgi:hypothetical protein
VTHEDQVVDLFARANPVPSLDLLDPVEPLDLHQLAHRSERSAEMTELKTPPKESSTGRRRRLIPVLTVTLAALVALAALVTADRRVASPEAVANAYMEARANLDVEATQALFASEATFDDSGYDLSEMPALYAWYRASNWTSTLGVCTEAPTGEGGTLVRCTNEFENDWSRALGDAPIAADIQILVSDGEIVSLTSEFDDEFVGLWDAFFTFVDNNHPDDVDLMYGAAGPLLDDESIALWEQHTRDFVASLEG